MRDFIESVPGKGLQPIDDGSEVRVRATRGYFEVEYKAQSEIYLTLYYIPRSESSVFIAACWDHAFDGPIEGLSDDDALETVTQTWPTLAQLLANGIEDRYSQGALIVLEDPDCGEKKWFVASVAGNLDLGSLDGLFTEETQEVARLVIECSTALMGELQENQPSLIGGMGMDIVHNLIRMGAALLLS